MCNDYLYKKTIMKSTLLAVLLSCSAFLYAQTAPDFILTDSRGVQHVLYQDYLDQGQSVVLKIFFTSCPPCNAIAPDLQELYVEWGEGMHDVQFIELSDKSFDTDSRVNSYKDRHSSTIPAAGASGGSLDAVDPYSRAPIGPYFGTPTFVVIAPDGTYEFDVPARIPDIDAAIARTGAEKPESNQRQFAFNVELLECPSQLTPNATNITVELRPIAGAPDGVAAQTLKVPVTSEGFVQLTVDELPDFAFYEYKLLNDNDIDCGNPANGLNTLDLIAIQRHILGTRPFEDVCRLSASDADGNENINVLDLLEIQKVLLGLASEFERAETCFIASGCNSEWRPLADDPESTCNEPFYLIRLGNVN